MADHNDIAEISAEIQRLNVEYEAQRAQLIDTADRLIRVYRQFTILTAEALQKEEKTPE